jgi:hypothetical protein
MLENDACISLIPIVGLWIKLNIVQLTPVQHLNLNLVPVVELGTPSVMYVIALIKNALNPTPLKKLT